MALPGEICTGTQDAVHICVSLATDRATARQDGDQGRRERMVGNGNFGMYF